MAVSYPDGQGKRLHVKNIPPVGEWSPDRPDMACRKNGNRRGITVVALPSVHGFSFSNSLVLRS